MWHLLPHIHCLCGKEVLSTVFLSPLRKTANIRAHNSVWYQFNFPGIMVEIHRLGTQVGVGVRPIVRAWFFQEVFKCSLDSTARAILPAFEIYVLCYGHYLWFVSTSIRWRKKWCMTRTHNFMPLCNKFRLHSHLDSSRLTLKCNRCVYLHNVVWVRIMCLYDCIHSPDV